MANSSRMPVTAAPAPPARQGAGLRSPVTWVIVLGVALIGGAFLLYRSRAASSGTSTSTASTPAGSSNVDWSGEIATLQTEIMDLQSSAAQDSDTSTDADTDMVTVPDVKDIDVEQATQILRAAGLKVTAPAGAKGVEHIVTKQAPPAGKKVKTGTTVSLTTRTEKEKQPAPRPRRRANKPGVNPIRHTAPAANAAAHHVTRKAA